jgi:GPH family glycoside/pentoside/hexuronide:cation symporter
MKNNGIPKIKLREKMAYGLGDMASNVVWSGIAAYITYYYTNAVHIAASAAGTIFFVSRIFDGISDVFMGIIVDKTKSKHGKARPWLLWMAVPFFAATVLLFAVPDISPQGKII